MPHGLVNRLHTCAHHLHATDRHLVDNLTHAENRAMLQIYDVLLTMTSYVVKLADVFVLFAIKDASGTICYHYMEFGDYQGYLRNSSKFPAAPALRIYTIEDIARNAKNNARKSELRVKDPQFNKRFKLLQIKNKLLT